MNIDNEKQLIKLLELLGLKHLELNDQIEVKEKLTEIIESVAKEQTSKSSDKINEYKTVDFAETIIRLVENRIDKLCESDTSQFNYFSIVNAAKNLNGSNAVLSGLLVAILAELTGDNKYYTIAKSLVSRDGNQSNESAELYLYKKAQGLTLKQQEFMLEMLENCTIEEIDKRFDRLLKESTNSDKPKQHTCVCPHCNHELESTKECNLLECPECGESKMITKQAVNDGIGFTELRKVNENKSPFDDDLDQYKTIWNKE
jgi:DNA-directed RNA polymerase subunit RPC12/RpoP